MTGRFRWIGPAGLALVFSAAIPAADAGEATPVVGAPPIELPQARIHHVDLSQWPKVRVLATVLDRLGKPIQPKAIKAIKVVDGKVKSRAPYIQFKLGQPLENRKDGKLQPGDKAGLQNAVVLLAAGYQDPSLREGSLGRRLKEALLAAFKPLAKTDRVNLVWYADRIQKWLGLKGKGGLLSDVEESKAACRDARAEAASGGEITLAGPPGKESPPPPPGTDLCGMTGNTKAIVTILKGDLATYEGYFPRLFNLGKPFWSHARYCKPPREALKGFGEFSAENTSIQETERKNREMKGEELDYQTSAFDEALKLLVQDARPEERKALIIVSDGRDGYFRDLQLCQETPPKSCAIFVGERKKFAECMADFLRRRVAAEQLEFKTRAAHWIGTARAAGVRVFAVGLGMLGQPHELDRLRLLAERTGGTFRMVDKEENLAGEVATAMAEAVGPLVIDFTHQQPEDAGQELNLRLAIDLDPSLVRGDTVKLDTQAFVTSLPAKLEFRQKVERGVRGTVAKLQDLLGYKLYVVLGLVVLVIGGLVALLITFLILRKIVRAIRGS
ncbi:MAG: hypothetical protein EXR79_00585 [Myxococcales bacterium]|nr:hypothetical protein [Myxococcales bacterium]